jgi:hypothetical protein
VVGKQKGAMSGKLAGMVWDSALSRRLKPLAACLADNANDDGSGVFPSVEYVVWRLSGAESTVRAGMGELRQMGVLTAVENAKGGRGKIPVCEFNSDKLPVRPGWKGSRKKGPESRRKGPENPSAIMKNRQREPSERVLSLLCRNANPQPVGTPSSWKIFNRVYRVNS